MAKLSLTVHATEIREFAQFLAGKTSAWPIDRRLALQAEISAAMDVPKRALQIDFEGGAMVVRAGPLLLEIVDRYGLFNIDLPKGD